MLTLTEQLALDILNAVNSNDIHNASIAISKGFISSKLNRVQVSCLREACTDKLKSFGYKACGGTGR